MVHSAELLHPMLFSIFCFAINKEYIQYVNYIFNQLLKLTSVREKSYRQA